MKVGKVMNAQDQFITLLKTLEDGTPAVFKTGAAHVNRRSEQLQIFTTFCRCRHYPHTREVPESPLPGIIARSDRLVIADFCNSPGADTSLGRPARVPRSTEIIHSADVQY